MNYQLSIREHNIKPHLDLEEEVKVRKNGILTFTLRVNNGNIVDLNLTEYVDVPSKYRLIKTIVIDEFVTTHGDRE